LKCARGGGKQIPTRSTTAKTQIETDSTITTWSYDQDYRLLALLAERRTSGPAGTNLDLAHSYDKVGNRTVLRDGATITTYTCSPANRLTLAQTGSSRTTYTNDAAGNRTGMQPQGEASSIYAWDAAGRMIEADVEAGTASAWPSPAHDSAAPATSKTNAHGTRARTDCPLAC
jgi:hypothetical protein